MAALVWSSGRAAIAREGLTVPYLAREHLLHEHVGALNADADHPSVAILPAALAVAEEIDAPASAVLDALPIEAEVSIRSGMVLGRRHYDRGFHQTVTAGAFGAPLPST